MFQLTEPGQMIWFFHVQTVKFEIHWRNLTEKKCKYKISQRMVSQENLTNFKTNIY